MDPRPLRSPSRSLGVSRMIQRRQLRLAFSRKTLNTSPISPTILKVPFRMLPIVSLETWRQRRMLTQLERIAGTRPAAFAVLEKLVDRTCARMDQEQTG